MSMQLRGINDIESKQIIRLNNQATQGPSRINASASIDFVRRIPLILEPHRKGRVSAVLPCNPTNHPPPGRHGLAPDLDEVPFSDWLPVRFSLAR